MPTIDIIDNDNYTINSTFIYTVNYLNQSNINNRNFKNMADFSSYFYNHFLDYLIKNLNFKFDWFIYFVLILIIWLTAFGNVLVCLAVYKEKKLQTSTNLFLISLAVADLMVALFVMPTSFIVEILHYYPFDSIWCIIWIILDILFCTSSIHHMSTMALDRYLTIKFPFKYGRNKSRRIAFIKICIIWLISICLCSPLLILSLLDQTNVYDSKTKQCVLINKSFKVYGSIFAFYIPFIVMLIAYVKTIRILKLILNNKEKLDEIKRESRNYGISKTILSKSIDNHLNVNEEDLIYKSKSLNQIEKISQKRKEEECKICINKIVEKTNSINLIANDLTQVKFEFLFKKHSMVSLEDSNNKMMKTTATKIKRELESSSPYCPNSQKSINNVNINKPRSASLNTDISNKVYSDLRKMQFVNRKNLNQTKRQSTIRSISNNNNHYSSATSNIQNMKKVANNERKALRVLIIMFTVFATLWSPFFILNTLSTIFEDVIKRVLSKYESLIYSILTWLGYLSSMANPIVYTMFNKSFRKAFLNIFTCKLKQPSNNRIYYNNNHLVRRNHNAIYNKKNNNKKNNNQDSVITTFHI